MTESRKLTTLDYRLFDIQHAVLPTRLPLLRFYQELVSTQAVINRKHLGWQGLKDVARLAAGLALKGQTNFLRMLWKFNSVYNADRQYSDHLRETRYQMRPPDFPAGTRPRAETLYIHNPRIQIRDAQKRWANGQDTHPSPDPLNRSESFEQSGNS
jgi:hypothetical protein